MKESPNKDNPQADVSFIVEELLDLFSQADDGLTSAPFMDLRSQIGSTFHARVLNAAKHLGLM